MTEPALTDPRHPDGHPDHAGGFPWPVATAVDGGLPQPGDALAGAPSPAAPSGPGVVPAGFAGAANLAMPAGLAPVMPAGDGTPGVLSSYATGRDPGLFNIDIAFQGNWTAELQGAFVRAVQTIEGIIQADVPDVRLHTPAGTLVVDDILITATLGSIDGVDGVLGGSGPTALRPGSLLPVLAEMTFDQADAQALQAQTVAESTPAGPVTETLWDATVEHEMLHALGFGTLWALKGLVSGASYIGPAGELAYARLADPAATTGLPVPLETTGGTGTAGGHWSEAVFGTELMTGYLDPAYAPLSNLTAASLADLGYGIGPGWERQVDSYALV